jgi:zinc-finger-containing domain
MKPLLVKLGIFSVAHPIPTATRRTRIEPVCDAQMPVPKLCPHCFCLVKFVNNRKIYGQPHGAWPWAYLCSNNECAAHIGVKPQTAIPLGTLATSRLREARKRIAASIEELARRGDLSRQEIAGALATELGLRANAYQVELLDTQQCQAAAQFLVQLKGLRRS